MLWTQDSTDGARFGVALDADFRGGGGRFGGDGEGEVSGGGRVVRVGERGGEFFGAAGGGV